MIRPWLGLIPLFRSVISFGALAIFASLSASAADAVDDFAAARRSMVEDVAQLARTLSSEGQPSIDQRSWTR